MRKAIKRIFALACAAAAALIPMQAFAAEDDMTLRENLGFAAQNTVIGIVTVFCMLLLMALIIYLFRFLPKFIGLFQRKDKSKQEQKKETADEEMNASTPPPVREQAAAPPGSGQTAASPLTDDAELVAVITAAIAAVRGQEEQVPAGSFVVRTIKKRA